MQGFQRENQCVLPIFSTLDDDPLHFRHIFCLCLSNEQLPGYCKLLFFCNFFLPMNIWVKKTRHIPRLYVVLLFRICYVSNGNMLLRIYWKIGWLWFVIYPKTLFLLQAKSSIEKCNFYVHFHVRIGGDIARKTFFSLFPYVWKSQLLCWAHLKSCDHSLDCVLYHFHTYFSSIVFLGNPTYISNTYLLRG